MQTISLLNSESTKPQYVLYLYKNPRNEGWSGFGLHSYFSARAVVRFWNRGGAHCTEIDFALSFGAVIVKMIDLSKTDSKDFFGIILDQENSQKLHLLPKSC